MEHFCNAWGGCFLQIIEVNIVQNPTNFHDFRIDALQVATKFMRKRYCQRACWDIASHQIGGNFLSFFNISGFGLVMVFWKMIGFA